MSLSWVVSILQAHREGWRRQALEGRGTLSSWVTGHFVSLGPNFLFCGIDWGRIRQSGPQGPCQLYSLSFYSI